MKKILFVITKSNWGGAQRYVYDLATSLPKGKFEAVVALGGNGVLKQKLEAAGVRTVTIGSLQRDVSISKELAAYSQLKEIFKKEKPHVVHLNSSKAGALGAIAARVASVPTIIFTAHGWPFAEKRSVLWRLFAYLGSWVTALFATKVICVSERDLQLAKRMLFVSHKALCIHNGINLHAPFGSGDVIRSAFPAGAHITGTIGELNKNKNQIALIEEAKSKPEMYVAIVGEGELRGYLEQKIKEYALESRVKLFGFMPAVEVLKGFDTFTLPSIKEGLPYVLLEAKAAGLPIVTSQVGGIPEILNAPNMDEFTLENMVSQTQKLY